MPLGYCVNDIAKAKITGPEQWRFPRYSKTRLTVTVWITQLNLNQFWKNTEWHECVYDANHTLSFPDPSSQHWTVYTRHWRIQDFSRWVPTPEGMRQPITLQHFAENCIPGASPSPLDPPLPDSSHVDIQSITWPEATTDDPVIDLEQEGLSVEGQLPAF